MLTVNVEQLLAQLAQLCGRGGAAVDPGAALALRVHRAAQQQGFTDIKTGVLQPVMQAHGVVEFGAHLGARGPFTDDAAIGPGTGDQLQRVNQDGFARAGFTREHGEAALQIQLQLTDDDEIAQGNAFEAHGQAIPSFQ